MLPPLAAKVTALAPEAICMAAIVCVGVLVSAMEDVALKDSISVALGRDLTGDQFAATV